MFRNLVVIRSIAYLLIYLFLIFNSISVFTVIPIFFLLVFVFTVLNISTRSDMDGLDKSLDNIVSVDVLRGFNSR